MGRSVYRTGGVHDKMIIHSLYGLSAPDPELIAIREAKVASLISQMGSKYLLTSQIQRKDKK
jgi:hypothetical protein